MYLLLWNICAFFLLLNHYKTLLHKNLFYDLTSWQFLVMYHIVNMPLNLRTLNLFKVKEIS